MKKIFILPAFLCLSILDHAQSVNPDVIGTAGDFFTSAGGQVQWTIGEVMIETYASSNNFVTQGFHQPDYGVLTAVTVIHHSTTILLYPIPATDQVSVSFGNASGNYSVELFDLLGKSISTTTISMAQNNTGTFSVKELANGTYFAKITEGTKGTSESFKIIISK